MQEIRICLIMNENSYAGREFLFSLKKEGVKVDVLSIGNFPKENTIEDDRCGKLWNPQSQNTLSKYHHFYNFESLKSQSLINFIKTKEYNLGIQGGTGIINNLIISCFRLGILNFHPGLLPKYRGCSAPEWQIYEGEKVYSTCHLIDENIDTGDIIEIRELNVSKINYHKFRTSIYIETGKFLVDLIKEIKINNGFRKKPYKQDERSARYLKFIGENKIDNIKKNYFQESI